MKTGNQMAKRSVFFILFLTILTAFLFAVLMENVKSNWNSVSRPSTNQLESGLMPGDNNGWDIAKQDGITLLASNVPNATFVFSTQPTNKTVNFDASRTKDTNGTIDSYLWDFGDGETDSGVSSSHTYVDSGYYTVTLTIIDNEGRTSVATKQIAVATILPPIDWVEIIAISVSIIFPITAVIVWTKKKKQSTFSGILPSGWQFYSRPTTGEPPGTIFRITSDKKKYWVKQLNVKIHPCDESMGRYTRRASMELLLRFHGLSKIDFSSEANWVQQLVFEMKSPQGESTYDADLDPLLNKWLESPGFEFRKNNRYFVIRDVTKTKAINYQLNNEQATILKEKTSLKEGIIDQGTSFSSTDQQYFILPQEFNEPMRIMFNAEEIKMELVKGKIKLSHHPVKGILEWTE
jgi:hypothetical protein